MNEATTMAKRAPEANLRAEPVRRSQLYFSPLVDVHENEQELIFFADMPGVRPEDVHLHYEKGELTLHGHVTPDENRQFLLNEFQVGDFTRTFSIHESVDADKISAEMKNGVLIVHLPKREEAKPRVIAIKNG